MTLTINTDRLLRELHHLASLTDCPPTEDKTLPAPTQAVTPACTTARSACSAAWKPCAR